MVTYVIASKANHPFLAECEALGEFLEANSLNVTVKTVIKDREEWKGFLDSCCKSYGFKKRSCPIVYTIEGTLIGDCGQFISHVKERYLKDLPVAKEELKRRTADNVNWIADLMRKKHKGPTLREEILEHLEKVRKKGLVRLTEAFYTEEHQAGVPFVVRRTDTLPEARLKHIPDEVQEQADKQKAFEEAEAKRDMTFDEFKAKYADHIQGKAKPQKGGRKRTDKDEEADVQNTSQNDASEGEGEEDEEEGKENPKTPDNAARAEEAFREENAHLIVPESCHLQMLQKVEIATLDENFRVVAAPEPLIEGELLVFQQKAEDQYDEDLIVYKDFSLRKRMKTPQPVDLKDQKITKESLKKEEEEEAASAKISALQSLKIDIEKPLSKVDWNCFAKIINEVQGLGFVQVLPTGQKASKPYQFNMLHVLPSYKIPVQLPLDVMISQRQTELAREVAAVEKENKAKGTGARNKPDPYEGMTEVQVDFRRNGILQLEEYQFPHCVLGFQGEQSGEQLNESFNRARVFLEPHRDQGFSLLVAPKWLFLAPLGGPYLQKNGVPVYLDGYAYAGIVDIQQVAPTWPATASLEDDSTQVMEAFQKSAEFTPEPEPVEESKPPTPQKPASPAKSKPATPNQAA